MGKPGELYLLSDKSLPQAIIPGLISYCPSIDLVALSTTENHVSVYRLNGQLVYGVAQKPNDLRVDSLHWKPNGKLFAVAWSDGCVRLINAESGKTVHQFTNDHQVSKVTCMGWCSNKMINSTASSFCYISKEIEKFMQNENSDFLEDQVLPLDLPRDVSLIDIETSLPKLSTLPAGGDSEDIFCTRSSLDALISPFDPKDNDAVDVMIFGTKEGKIHIIIYDSFFIGSFESPLSVKGKWKASRELPDKFLRSINETLNQNYQCGIVQALCHSLATGHIYPPVKEWLMHEISERGHKRWEKAVLTGLGNLKRIIHENMLPALERFTVILSRFIGIAKFQPLNETVGFTSQHISLLMDTIACLHLIFSKILSQVVDEIDLFTYFSAWIRYEIDKLTSDFSSTLAEDTTEKESLIDHSKVFFYLQTILTCTPLADHFRESLSLDDTSEFSQTQEPLFEIISQHLKNKNQGLDYNKSVLSVKFHCDELSIKAVNLFQRIAGSEKCNVIFGKEIPIGIAEPHTPMDLRLEMKDISTFPSYFAFVPKGMPNCVRVVRVKIPLKKDDSLYDCLESFTIQLGEGSVEDIKYFDGDSLFILWKSDQESTKLLNLPYKEAVKATSLQATNYVELTSDLKLEYSPYTHTPSYNSLSASNITRPDIFIETKNVTKYFSKYEIPSEDHQFKPEYLSVRKILGKNHYQHYEQMTKLKTNTEDDQRIILLDQGGFHYRVYSTTKTI
ncbi:putative anaphase-promoting complex component cut20 apc4 [Erysiphe necator]|uniref:Anaphase-promoting complex subunit 4 n=1 Tax=Uncinula necator TaxID=52586 RepID=A0A0B1PE84_UNCNE|nr:putative anaphase-promoting complex component cut20 apc4 [Erysiphe necator]